MAHAVRERLADAAFELFSERGYELTTVDDIAERAGVGRTTFFRHYRSKDDVIFPDHDQLIEAIRVRLATSTDRTAIVAVSDAVRLVLFRYLEDGDRARRRYELTSRVRALRDREIATVARYQRLFREFISSWMGDSTESALRAELMAASVVAAHNHVLRRWLRSDTADPAGEVDAAMAQVIALFPAEMKEPATKVTTAAGSPPDPPASPLPPQDGGTTVVVFRTSAEVDDVISAIKRTVG